MESINKIEEQKEIKDESSFNDLNESLKPIFPND